MTVQSVEIQRGRETLCILYNPDVGRYCVEDNNVQILCDHIEINNLFHPILGYQEADELTLFLKDRIIAHVRISTCPLDPNYDAYGNDLTDAQIDRLATIGINKSKNYCRLEHPI